MAMSPRILRQSAVVRLVGVPRDVAGMPVGQQDCPVLARDAASLGSAIAQTAGLMTTERERASVARVVQHLEDPRMGQGLPMQIALARPAPRAAWKVQPLLAEVLDRGGGGAGSGEGGEQGPQRVLHLGVRIEHHPIERVVGHPHRQRHFEYTALGPVYQPSAQAGIEQVKLRLAHGAFEPEQQSVVELRGVVDAVLVEDQGLGQAADL